MLALIAGGVTALEVARKAAAAAQNDRKLWLPITECRLLAPVPRPQKNVFCVGRNYKFTSRKARAPAASRQAIRKAGVLLEAADRRYRS